MKNSFIIQNVRNALLRRLILPLLLLTAAFAVRIGTPRDNFFRPRPLNYKSHYENFYNRNLPHVTVEVPELSYTGLDYTANGRVCGHYYYTLEDGFCQFYLLRKSAGEVPASYLGGTSLRGRLVRLGGAEYEDLVENMAGQLNWDADSLREISAPYAVSSLPYPFYLNLLFYLLLYGCLLASSVDLVCSCYYIIRPFNAPAFRHLRVFGDVRTLLPRVEMELRHITIARSGSLCLTPNYRLNLDASHPLILPLQSVVWIYYHGHMSRIPGLRPKLSYRLYLAVAGGQTCVLPGKQKEGLDLILRILTERRPEILIGYSEQNKAEAKTLAGNRKRRGAV